MESAKPAKLKLTSLFSSLGYTARLYWEDQKATLFLCAAAIILRVALPYIGILMPKLVLDEIEAAATTEHFVWVVGGMALLLVALNYCKSFADQIVNNAVGTAGIFRMLIRQSDKQMDMDYALMEDPDAKAVKDKADKAIQSNHSPAMNIPRTVVEVCANTLGLLLYAGVILTVHPAILAVLALSAAVNWHAMAKVRKYIEENREAHGKLYRGLEALHRMLREGESAKDIRLYQGFPWLSGRARNQMERCIEAEDTIFIRQMRANMLNAALVLLRDGLAYAFLIYLLLNDRLSLGDFVFAFAAIGALAGWISGLLTAGSDLAKAGLELNDVRAFLDAPDRMNRGQGVPLPTGDKLPPSITLEHVGYTYPKAEKPTLVDINLTIRPGESIAIVGANGAGKTTLVKLLCGLYLPTEGEVRLNEHRVAAFNRDEYYSLFSPVFQDIHLLAEDIAANISQRTPEDTDMARVWQCLEMSGLAGKVRTLPAKEKTMLVKPVNAEAIDLSGGEKQKLGMARALYKDAPVLILDEPTAALDPIAENEVYQKYAELTKGKTSVFISHRLASTRFCDRILLINGNTVTEQGTHDELMRLGGVYAHMFEVQASYYRDAKKDDGEVAQHG